MQSAVNCRDRPGSPLTDPDIAAAFAICIVSRELGEYHEPEKNEPRRNGQVLTADQAPAFGLAFWPPALRTKQRGGPIPGVRLAETFSHARRHPGAIHD